MDAKKIYQMREHFKHVWLSLRNIPKPLGFPRILGIELNSICNAKCIFCPTKSVQRQKFMAKELFYKIIDQCIGKNVEMIQPHLYGEFFIHPECLEHLRYIRQKLPQAKINIITNAVWLTEQKAKAIIKEHLADSIVFSINAYTKGTYKDVIGIDEFDRAEQNIMQFIVMNRMQPKKQRIKTSASFILCDENEHELAKFRRHWRGIADEVRIGSDDGKETGKPFIENRWTQHPCIAPFREMLITSDGKAMFCCIDAHCRFPMGDLNSQTIEEIWTSNRYKTLRWQHLKRRKEGNPVCRGCFVTY